MIVKSFPLAARLDRGCRSMTNRLDSSRYNNVYRSESQSDYGAIVV